MNSSANLNAGREREATKLADALAGRFEPSLFVWSEELERRRLAVARWRGLDSDACEQKTIRSKR